MNIYEKLQTARCELQKKKLNKSGKNKFANYTYFELADFLPTVNEIFKGLNLFSAVYFGKEYSFLKVINSEEPKEFVIFNSPNAKASLKGAQDIQNIGAIETYQRRYLYMLAMEIVEHDAIDAGGKVDKPKETAKAIELSINEAQIKRLYAIGKGAGIDGRTINDLIFKELNKKPLELTKKEYDKYCERLESVKKKPASLEQLIEDAPITLKNFADYVQYIGADAKKCEVDFIKDSKVFVNKVLNFLDMEV